MKAMTIMAWDTATPWCVAALERFEADGSSTALGRFVSREAGTHSQVLPGAVAQLLREAGLRPSDLDLLAVGRGPGSFTGLRTGLALAKGLALGAGLPLIGLSTLEVLAASALKENGGPALAAPLIDARHQQIFAALYQREAGNPEAPPRLLAEARPLSPAELPDYLLQASEGREVFLTGPALDLAEAAFPTGWPGPLSAALQPEAPEAAELARLARFLWLNTDKAEEGHPAIPMYIRQPDIRRSGLSL